MLRNRNHLKLTVKMFKMTATARISKNKPIANIFFYSNVFSVSSVECL